ncbi:MAG: stimulus-sensing domain-containing protein [Pseudomonadota bacterium]
MASDTDIKNNKSPKDNRPRWFRLAPARPDLPEFDHLMDLYWGGSERRITGITLRIIAVNAIALLILMFGLLYLGQYQNSLINARLETFEAELELIAGAVSEGAIELNESEESGNIDATNAREMILRLSKTSRQRIQLFDTQGNLITDSRALPGADDRIWAQQDRRKESLQSVAILKEVTKFILELLPDRRSLPRYPETFESNLEIPDVADALEANTSVSAWENKRERIFLSAASPVFKSGKLYGAVLITREGNEIEEDIGGVWVDILRIFLGTLFVTILLSIYLSGVIARPLKRLARSAEAVRSGQATTSELPDLSDRHDEIGELSVVLKQMTEALWERMDATEQFAADVAHELKNPLTSLRSAVETASIVKKDADRKKLMDIVRHDIERLDRLITDISNASRIDAELSREAFEKINLGTLLSNIIDAYAADPLKRQERKAKDSNATSWPQTVKTQNATIILNSTSVDDIWLWGLESRLAQVFQNLISNALTFSPKGGTLKIDIQATPKKVTVTFEDEGPGIPENKLETIFERFYSERPEHENYGQHSGLGLSICKQIIKAHSGQIFAENARDKNKEKTGARFSVVLNRA